METRFEIVSDFYIGILKTIQYKSLNQLYETKKIIDCTKDLSFLGQYKQYTNPIHQQSLYHQEQQQFIQYILNTCETINNSLLQEESILICCSDCTQISPTIALIFLIKYANLSFRDALRCILSKVSTPVFQPNIQYLNTIKPLL